MIGNACAHLFAHNRMKGMLTAHTKEKLESLSQIRDEDFQKRSMDVCSETDVQRIINQTIESFHRIDAVIYNAAIYPYKSIEECDLLDWKKGLDTNLTGAFAVTKACIPIMKKQGFGKIVFISSIAGENIGLPCMSAYASSKAGLNGFMRTAAIELAPFNINVNSISPGKVYDPQTLTAEERDIKLSPVPLKRFVHPNDVAEMAFFLISDKANSITGQNFIIDGGQSILGEERHLKV